MKIAILSDIHDNIWSLQAALTAVQDTELLICCGDLCSPFIVPILAEGYPRPIHLSLGNNDGDLFRITKNASSYDHFYIQGEYFETEIDGKKFAVNHYDNIGLEIARQGAFDVVCFGHNHRYQVERFGKTLAINPGALMGYSPLDQQKKPPTFVKYDTSSDSVETYQISWKTGGQVEMVAYLVSP